VFHETVPSNHARTPPLGRRPSGFAALTVIDANFHTERERGERRNTASAASRSASAQKEAFEVVHGYRL